MSDSSPDPPLPALGDLEAEVMQLLWALGPATADTVRGRLPRPLKESTVRTVLHRLEAKGYVDHQVDGRTFIYRPRNAEDVAAHGVRGLAELIYKGSVSDLLVGLVGSSQLKPAELDELSQRIEQARTRNR